MRRATALEGLLCDAGVAGRTARWLAWLVDRTSDIPEGSDGLAAMLLQWRRREAVDSYECGLRDGLNGMLTTSVLPEDDDPLPTVEEFVSLFDALDQTGGPQEDKDA